MKTFKLYGSSSGCCLKFDLYVEKKVRRFQVNTGKTCDLVIYLMDGYKKLAYIVYTGNFYTGPD